MDGLRSWALRGLAASNSADSDNASTDANTLNDGNNEAPLTAEEMRALRLAKMEALQQKQREEQERMANREENMQQEPEAMDVDSPAGKTGDGAVASQADQVSTAAALTKAEAAKPSSPSLKKKAKSDSQDKISKKIQREKELMLKKCLSIALAGSALASDSSCTVIDIGSTEITVQTVAEILAERISMHHTLPNAGQNSLIRYLGTSHRLAAQELKDLQSFSSSPKSSTAPSAVQGNEAADILVEIQRQLVSYAASCIMELDLFPAGQDAAHQLAMCLLTTISDLNTSIILGVNKSTSSFFYLLVEELKAQDADLKKIVSDVVNVIVGKLFKVESVLDVVDGGNDGVILVSALAAFAMHKDTAKEMVKLENFLLPAEGSEEAKQVIRPQMNTGNLFMMLTGEARPYKKRSGPALEKNTILGLALRIGVPTKANPAFSPSGIFNMTVNAMEGITRQQRNKLTSQREANNQLIKALIKAGEETRARVMDWIRDALLVNYGADAMRPDASKVSSPGLLLNLSAALLKLCEPLVLDADNKIQFIKPSFVSSPRDHGGVFETTGDHAVARLGSLSDGEDAFMIEAYNPKNRFISPCFFFCARSLHYGLAPALSHHESLLRHIMYQHHDIRDAGRDIRSDPHFGMLLCRQRAAEVALFEPTQALDTLKFCDFMSRVLLEMDDKLLRTMPEDFINDCCSIITSIAKLKSELLKGLTLRYVFQMSVKMLSPGYGTVRRLDSLSTCLTVHGGF